MAIDPSLDHVAGYSCYNEGSVREYQSQNRQFGLGKNFERSGSFGPWLMTADEFGDPADHTVMTRLNGIERQNAKISGMVFDVARLVEYLSEGYTLQPGDVIVTGSPRGVAAAARRKAGGSARPGRRRRPAPHAGGRPLRD